MQLEDKLAILADSAKYDVACTSSGVDRAGVHGKLGCSVAAGICHSFTPDGRCISLLKILFTNECIFDCRYCMNRRSNDVLRTSFTPEEVCTLTMEFYRRNYIEGLFLSSGIIVSPTHTMQLLLETVRMLRLVYHFNGYIHVKTIPGCSKELIDKLGNLVDRTSINIELPSNDSLKLLAPQKEKTGILTPMKYISDNIKVSNQEKSKYKDKFVPAGQTTQLIVGATPETDFKIMKLSEGLYNNFKLKRVYYSAYVSINNDSNLPALKAPPLLRENRLYQADWLIRFYGFKIDDLLDNSHPNFNNFLDPKCDWAIRHIENFPVEINKADYYTLLKVPGIGVASAKRIITARRLFNLTFDNLKNLGIVLKRARYFITCNGKYYDNINRFNQNFITENLLFTERVSTGLAKGVQTSLFDSTQKPVLPSKTLAELLENKNDENYKSKVFSTLAPTKFDMVKSITGSL